MPQVTSIESQKKNPTQIIYAFIDSQNLNVVTSKDIDKNNKVIDKEW